MVQDKTPQQALCHLFFHCCYRDNNFDKKEIDQVAAILVDLDIHRDINFKNEILNYTLDVKQWTDDRDYIKHLIGIIKPVNTLALFSWCVEISLSDELISLDEQQLLNEIAGIFNIEDYRKEAIKAVMVERKVALLNKVI